MSVVAGVDGCRGGWVAAYVDVTGREPAFVGFRVAAGLAEVCADPSALAIAVDIPIGLPGATGTRACDVAARRLLTPHGSRVFPAPVRATLAHADDYAAACDVSRSVCGKALSRQAWNILGKIAEADACANDPRVVESHPEVGFTLMAGEVVRPSKKSAEGRQVRRSLLAEWLGSAPQTPSDDHIDALGCAWSAARVLSGTAIVLGDGACDEVGRPMRIVC